MPLSIRKDPYVIPSYSLTGDLLAFRKCGLQYRFHNRGSLPPSRPVQLWFGEFIHGVMEEGYRRWNAPQVPPMPAMPWAWDPTVFAIEKHVDARLRAKGLYPSAHVWDKDGKTQLIVSKRSTLSLEVWGQDLFPLIKEAELLLQGIRDMPPNVAAKRADYYEVKGVVDVLSSVKLASAPHGNKIIDAVMNDPTCRNLMETLGGGQFEVIVDYKGTRRPPIRVSDTSSPLFGTPNQEWSDYQWQVLTYSWLRSQQPGAQPVLAGILLFLNELYPSESDFEELKDDVLANATDLMPTGADLQAIRSWSGGPPPILSLTYRVARSLLVVPVQPANVTAALANFDQTVSHIEGHVVQERAGQGILNNWSARPELRTCTACDFKTYCPSSAQPGAPKVP